MKTTLIFLLILLALFCAYLLLLAARPGKKAMEELKRFRYAHRGYHDKPQVPENSMAAFRRAVQHGWGAELDVHLLKDGTLAVMHDSSLLRTAGADVEIEDLTREELRITVLRARRSMCRFLMRCWRCLREKHRSSSS